MHACIHRTTLRLQRGKRPAPTRVCKGGRVRERSGLANNNIRGRIGNAEREENAASKEASPALLLLLPETWRFARRKCGEREMP